MTTIATPTRVFRMNTIRLDDPDPSMDPNDVRELYAASYPHLAATTVGGPEVNDKHELVYTFEPPAVKTKGQPQQVMPAPMCQKHQWLLVSQAEYGKKDPWQALILIAQVALFQAATCLPKTHERTGGNIARIQELGCLACYRPDAFGEVVEAAKTHDLGNVKAVGEKFIAESQQADDGDRKP